MQTAITRLLMIFVKMAYEAYVSQAIEYDAKNFAEQYGDLAGITPEYEGS